MPNKKVENSRVGYARDRRVKVQKDEHPRIIRLHDAGWSLTRLAAEFNCSRRLITFILDPRRKIAAMNGRTYKDYYTKEKRREYMRTHRAYKRKLLSGNP